MKALAYGLAYVLLVVVAGFGFIALTDTPVEQEQIVKDLPADKFIKAQ